MTDQHEALARQVVEQFRQSLSREAGEHITAAQFKDLEQSIHQLLAHERGRNADLVEALARSLRSGADKPELEL